MKELIDRIWVAPGITPVLVRHSQSCLICAECNPGRNEPTPTKCLPKALYPFQRIQIDHIQMPMCQGFQYVLVEVDLFSGWPEAYPVRNQTAPTTAKKIIQEIVCRFGVPEVIESDQGPAFTANLTQEVWKMIGSHLAFHTPYRPQSSDPNSLEGSHTLSPGEWVVVKKHVRGTLDPRYEGPYQVLLTTPTSLKLEGRPTWIHASHCKRIKCPPPPD
ncbi:protein NYNRIN-like [Pelodytes ibericus]